MAEASDKPELVRTGAAVAPAPAKASSDSSAEERKVLSDLYGKALESFDRLIVTISGGALVLSITVMEKVLPTAPQARALEPLVFGWACLAGSLSAIVISMLTGHKALEDALAGKPLTNFTQYTTALNIASAALMIAGLGGLAWYAYSNLPRV